MNHKKERLKLGELEEKLHWESMKVKWVYWLKIKEHEK